MKTPLNAISGVVDILLRANAIKAVKFLSPKLIVRAVRKTFDKKISADSNVEILLTIGRPNYVERAFIKVLQKAGEPFPVNKIQLKLYNPKPKKLARKNKSK